MSDGLIFFGGSFDPVHHGHLIVARAVAEQLGFGRIVLVPARQSPHKSRIFAPAADRLAMLKLATHGQDIFEISDVEIARTGPSYTIDTLEEYSRRHTQGRLAWVIGADMLADLPKWHRAKDLVEQFELIVAVRPPCDAAALETALTTLERSFGPRVAARLRNSVVHNPLINISSTDIRTRIAQGKSIAYLAPDAVIQYIRQHDLYR